MFIFRFPRIDMEKFEDEFEKIANHTLNSIVDGFICAISGYSKMYVNLCKYDANVTTFHRPFLQSLQKLRKKRKGKLRRLQLISTDDWDITDSLEEFKDISEILKVLVNNFQQIPILLQ